MCVCVYGYLTMTLDGVIIAQKEMNMREMLVPLIWFYVKATLESQPPLFQGTAFFVFGDILVLLIGLLGLARLIQSALSEI